MPFAKVASFGYAELQDLMELYRDTYWASDRSEADAREIVRNSEFLFGLRDEDTGRMVAFARVITDGVFIALLCDVVVHPSYRGRGLGGELMDMVMSDSRIARIHHVQLNCRPDVLKFYERWGFTDELGEIRTMRRSIRGYDVVKGR